MLAADSLQHFIKCTYIYEHTVNETLGTIVIVVGSVDIKNWGQFPQSHKRNCITNTRDDIVHEFRNNLATKTRPLECFEKELTVQQI